ncbi:MAG: hypothetical protein QF886_23225, partial [Planctomycetota bacterium]|nr:hypothetical protein [Planctomycetota bacterium]
QKKKAEKEERIKDALEDFEGNDKVKDLMEAILKDKEDAQEGSAAGEADSTGVPDALKGLGP